MMLILVLFAFGSALAGNCPDGFESHGASCYFFSHGEETWIGAYETCKDLFKAQLVEVDNEPENAYLSNKTKTLGSYYYWIGLTDKANEGEWVWESSFSPLLSSDYSNWASGEPDAGGGKHPENCVFYSGENHKWADAECDREERYICETIDENAVVVGK